MVYLRDIHEGMANLHGLIWSSGKNVMIPRNSGIATVI